MPSKNSDINEWHCLTFLFFFFLIFADIQDMEKDLEEKDQQSSQQKPSAGAGTDQKSDTKQRLESTKESFCAKQAVPSETFPKDSSEAKPPHESSSPPREGNASAAKFARRHRSGGGESSDDSEGPGPTPGTPGKRQKSHSPPVRHGTTIHFSSGNPSVEQVKGVLHLYKDRYKLQLRSNLLPKLC
jgi:hypothetical protein